MVIKKSENIVITNFISLKNSALKFGGVLLVYQSQNIHLVNSEIV